MLITILLLLCFIFITFCSSAWAASPAGAKGQHYYSTLIYLLLDYYYIHYYYYTITIIPTLIHFI